MVVYEDNTTKFQFEGIDNWACGKLERQVRRGMHELKSLQRKAQSEKKLAQHKKELAEKKAADKLAEELAIEITAAEVRAEYLNLKAVNGDITKDERNELGDLSKNYPSININEEVLNNDDGNERTEGNKREGRTGTDESPTGGSSADAEKANGGESSVSGSNSERPENNAGVNDSSNDGDSESDEGKLNG